MSDSQLCVVCETDQPVHICKECVLRIVASFDKSTEDEAKAVVASDNADSDDSCGEPLVR